jgi:hypothetical protein
MKLDKGTVGLGAALVAASGVLYALLRLAFADRVGDIVFYTALDIAFIPLQVLLVGVVLDRLLAVRERAAMLHKLNMVIGAYFSEVGRELIERLAAFDADASSIAPKVRFDGSWTDRDFASARASITEYEGSIGLGRGDADGLRAFLVERRGFMLGLLENPNLLEHESFTDMLWAVFHLTEELAARADLRALPASDKAHVELDARRAYGRVLREWLGYLRHLKADYPYLYSFEVRTNPFDDTSSIEVRD